MGEGPEGSQQEHEARAERYAVVVLRYRHEGRRLMGMEVTTDEPVETKWAAFDGTLWDRESDAIEHSMEASVTRVYLCPGCGDWRYTEEAARECCGYEKTADLGEWCG